MSEHIRGSAVPTSSGEALPPPAYICELGHRTPYYGGPLRVIRCPAPIGIRTTCGAQARYEVVPSGQ